LRRCGPGANVLARTDCSITSSGHSTTNDRFKCPASKRLYLDAFSRQRGSGRADHLVLKISVVALHRSRELVAIRAEAELKVVPVDSDPFSALVKGKGDIARVVPVWRDDLPRTMRAAENRVRVSAAEERAVGRKGQQILADAYRPALREAQFSREL
jgi:hypothetical protein